MSLATKNVQLPFSPTLLTRNDSFDPATNTITCGDRVMTISEFLDLANWRQSNMNAYRQQRGNPTPAEKSEHLRKHIQMITSNSHVGREGDKGNNLFIWMIIAATIVIVATVILTTYLLY